MDFDYQEQETKEKCIPPSKLVSFFLFFTVLVLNSGLALAKQVLYQLIIE
jgi:hypothetical protein